MVARMITKALVVDDEENIRFTFSKFLTKEGYHVVEAADYPSALDMISRIDFDLLFVDVVLGKHTGINILKKIKQKGIHSPVIMITGRPNVDTSAEAVRGGAFDYIPKPVRKKTLLRVAEHALRHKRLVDAKTQIEKEKEHYRKNLEAIFGSLKEGIITVDSDLNVIDVNCAVNDICGLKPKDITGKRFSEIKVKCQHSCLRVLQETTKTKNSVNEYRIECKHKDRHRQVTLLTSSPLNDSEKGFMGTVLVVKDISRLTFLEKELSEKHKYYNIIGKSNKIQRVYHLLENLLDSDTTVLITGESGTGKGVVAHALHYGGVRASRPLITINCSALAENLLESELFGHVKGAFTGAIADKTGRFQLADGGTVFLDEIGEISPYIQLKLLRFLQEHKFERVGDSKTIDVDVRIIAATNQNLKDKVRKGEFREDLFYRLNVIEIPLPLLRERREDIPLLTDHFCRQFNVKQNKNIEGVSTEVMEAFMRYPWPGNIRELKHAIEHAFVLCRDRIIMTDHLPLEILNNSPIRKKMVNKTHVLDSEEILGVLKSTDWNKAKTARILGISRPTLYKKFEELNIKRPG